MNPKRRTWWIWVVAALVVVAVLGGAAWLLLGSAPASTSGSATSGPGSSASVTPRPSATATSTATATARPTATATPTATAAPPVTPTPTPSTPAPEIGGVVPFIVAAGWNADTGTLSISATVPQIVESDGTCTFTASLGGASVSDSFAATPSAGSTDCGTHDLSSSDFGPGDWTVVVSYSSATSAGSSTNPNPVTIP